MVFSSALFLFYFLPLFLAGYFVLPKTWRNVYSATASLAFYAWGAPNFLLVFLASCSIDYVIVQRLSTQVSERPRRILLWISTLLNVGLLLYFKYSNFLAEQLGSILSALGLAAPHWTAIALPIGISFFTFHKISYVVDVFRGKSAPTENFAEYLLYITFFPQLIAGPIVRYHEIEQQIRARSISFHLIAEGVWRFAIGLAAKLLIADPLGAVADHIFNSNPARISTAYTWLGTSAYTMQIYFDFAGYSSMAVGLALLVGFRFPENFNRPYLAESVTDFWRRWHMSLSRWMRDYLYIPLGGNRVGRLRQALNLWTVFLLSGLWHGASWNFVAWGAFHGFFLACERSQVGALYLTIPSLVRRACTFLIVMFGWVIFRSATLHDGLVRWGRLLSINVAGKEPLLLARATVISNLGIVVLVAALLWCVVLEPLIERGQRRTISPKHLYETYPIVYLAVIILFMVSILALEAGQYSPFIYFQF